MAARPWLEAAEYDMGGLGATATVSSGRTCAAATSAGMVVDVELTTAIDGLVFPAVDCV